MKTPGVTEKYWEVTFDFGRYALILYHREGLTFGWCSAAAETPDDYDANVRNIIYIYAMEITVDC